jgi:hypothetical protein
MKRITTLGFGLVLALSAYACSDSGTFDAGGVFADAAAGYPDAAPGADADVMDMTPPPPALGAMIDRMGRAGVNTAVTDPFDAVPANGDAQKDMYNTAEEASWSVAYKSQFAGVIAIYDGLDGMCGNQFAAGMMLMAGRYDALAGVLADDKIYLDTNSATCTTYLAVEANATGIIPNTDCGGRKPEYDTIDVTYSILAIGAVSGVGDGIANDSTFTPLFPFFSAPN